MSHPNCSLWPPDIHPTIESPREILDGQARVLRDLTRGCLTAEVRVIHDEYEQRLTICLDMIASGGVGRHRILTASHSTDQIYPCVVQAPAALEDPVANSDHELRELIRQVLQTSEVKALAASLIAKSRQTAGPRMDERERRHKGHRRFRPAWAGGRS